MKSAAASSAPIGAEDHTAFSRSLELSGGLVPFACIGMSSGGLSPLKLIFRQLSPETGMVFVLIHHLIMPTFLPQILSFHTPMPVRQASDGEMALADHIYVLPPGMEMTICDSIFSLRPRSKPKGWPNVLTIFMDSLAKSRHPGIAVALSGLGNDGAAALKAFKRYGGVTIVQAPETADRQDLPLSWISTRFVDYVLEPDAVAPHLELFARVHFSRPSPL